MFKTIATATALTLAATSAGAFEKADAQWVGYAYGVGVLCAGQMKLPQVVSKAYADDDYEADLNTFERVEYYNGMDYAVADVNYYGCTQTAARAKGLL